MSEQTKARPHTVLFQRALSAREYLGAIGITLLCCFVFAVSLIHLNPFGGTDDINYIKAASALAGGDRPVGDAGTWRIAHILPMAFMLRFVSPSIFISTLVVPLFHALSLVFCYLVLRRIIGVLGALTGAFILGLNPLSLEFAGSIFPDVPLGFWLAAGLYLFFEGQEALFSSTKRLAYVFCLGSGFVFGVAVSVKLTALPFIAGVVLGGLLVRKIPMRLRLQTLGFLFAGGFCWALLDVLLTTQIFQLDHFDSSIKLRAAVSSEWVNYFASVVDQHGKYPLERFDTAYSVILMLLHEAIFPLLICWFIFPLTCWRYISLWLAVTFYVLAIICGTVSFEYYLPPPLADRLFCAVMPAFCIMLLASVVVPIKAIFSQKRRYVGWLRVPLIFTYCALIIWITARTMPIGASRFGNRESFPLLIAARDTVAYARENHPNDVLVFSQKFSFTFAEHLGPDFIDGSLMHWDKGEEHFPLPFLLIRPLSDRYGDRTATSFEGYFGAERIERRILKVFYPDLVRISDLRKRLWPILGDAGLQSGRISDYSVDAAVVLESWTPLDAIGAAETETGPEILFDSLKGNVRLYAVSPNTSMLSNGVEYTIRHKPSTEAELAEVQSASLSAMEFRPYDPGAMFAARAGTFKLQLNLLPVKSAVGGTAGLYLYDEQEVLQSCETPFSLKDEGEISISCSSAEKAESARFVLRFNSGAAQWYALQIKRALLTHDRGKIASN